MLVFRSPVVIRAATCAPVPGIRPTSNGVWFKPSPPNPCISMHIRNTGGCMRTRGGHRFALNEKCYLLSSETLDLAFMTFAAV